MPNKTKIEWATHSSNPIYPLDESDRRGWFCTKVSAGCAHCYAERMNLGRLGNGLRFLPANERRVQWVLNERELEAIRRLRQPARIFLADMTDLFHEGIPAAYLDAVFDTIEDCYWHTFMVLTKRPERMRDYITRRWDAAPNVFPQFIWFGVSVESPFWKNRIDTLRQIPARVRYLSIEPLLGDLGALNLEDIHWVIAGGESGGPARRQLVEQCCSFGSPFGPSSRGAVCPLQESRVCDLSDWHPKPDRLEWVRSIRDQASAAGVSFLFKGWGGPLPTTGGRVLDGREWNEMPAGAA